MAKAVQGERPGAGVILAGADREAGKVGVVALFSPADSRDKVSAADLIREIAPIVGGGGGGSDEMAQAGGKDPDRLEEAMVAARAWLEGR
jgi:alanyl-tRNA synthetase